MFDMNYRTFDVIMSGSPVPSAFDQMPESLKFSFYELTRATGLRDSDLAYFLEASADIQGALDQDFPQAIQTAEGIQARVNQEVSGHPLRYLLSGLILPRATEGVLKEATVVARLRCARTALAVERYRLKHGGALPSSLKELAPKFSPEVLENPVTGEPLKYETISGGYRVVAERVGEVKNKSDEADVSFTVLKK